MEQKKIKLKGHETFVIREGWLSKGMKAVAENPKVFSEMYGADALGVGTNMAKAIRYWLKAAGLTIEKNGKGVFLSEFGEMVYHYDPYIEEDFTLWCIHINLAENEELATSWYLFFRYCEAEEFTREELEELMAEEVCRYKGDADFSRRSLSDDCHVLLQMYGREKLEEVDPEDKKICPLVRLGLLRKNGAVFKRTQPDFNRFPQEVFLYFLQGIWKEEDAVSIEKLYEKTTKLLGLGMSGYQEYLDGLAQRGYVDINRTAGLDMIYKKTDMTRVEAAEKYYGGKTED